MRPCWNCRVAVPAELLRCEACGAAVPVGAEPAPEAKRPPPPTSPRSDQTGPLDRGLSGRIAYRATASRGAAPDATVLARGSRRRAALVLCACAAIVLLTWSMAAAPRTLEYANCWSTNEAERKGLLNRYAAAVPRSVTWGGKKIRILVAWVGQLAAVRYSSPFSPERTYFPSGKYRLYFKTAYDGWPQRPQFWTGQPLRKVHSVAPDAKKKKYVLHYVELDGPQFTSQEIFVWDETQPEIPAVSFEVK